MRSFFDWSQEGIEDLNKPWLILGKGPSFSKLHEFDTTDYLKLSLNHAVREVKVKLAHIVDFDVAETLGGILDENAEYVVMPWHPHVKCKASRLSLEELIQGCPVLLKLDSQGRLLWYNAQTSREPNPSSSVVVGLRYFSVEAALNLLALAGVKKIRTLGVDGGNSYSGTFKDLNDKTLLANGRTSFDIQFSELRKTIRNFNLDFSPLNLPTPVRVYVGGLEEQLIATKVLEFSIRNHSSMPVEITPLHRTNLSIPLPLKEENQPRTPFSFQRFLIPQLENFNGRAIYLDSDMQVFDDVRFLWEMPFDGADIITVQNSTGTNRKPQFSVMLLNCSALNWRISEIIKSLDNGEITYEEVVLQMSLAKNVRAALPATWNSLEHFKEGETKLLHYTDMIIQPWISTKNPLGKIWCRDLIAAVKSGFISMDQLRQHGEKGWIRPSLVYQVENEIEDPLKLRAKAKMLDAGFKAPYLAYGKGSKSRFMSLWRKLSSILEKGTYAN